MHRIITAVCALLLAVLPQQARAQYAATQDSTLRGLQRVYLNFAADEALGSAQAEQLAASAALELRKAGIRVVRDTQELDSLRDGILNISFIRSENTLSSNLSLRMDVEQQARLTRTQQTLVMVTWYHEEERRGIIPKDVAPALLTTGVNHFLSQWLDVNGR